VKVFDVETGARIRVMSNRVTYKSGSASKLLGEKVTWEGTTTACYRHAYGTLRRLIINPSIHFMGQVAVWTANLDCEVIKE